MLYIVATPIGNLEDITFHAVRILKEADVVLCEDTRVTKKLLAHYGIATPTLSYHQHSKGAKTDKIIALLQEGKTLALVTDAGTPGIADPGNRLVAEIAQALPETPIIPIPGASAVAAALSVSGFPTDEYVFMGFLPHKKGRQTAVNDIVASERTVVLYESVHRIVKLLQQLSGAGAGERPMFIAREATKLHETYYRGTVAELAERFVSGKEMIKGEFVVVVGV